MYYVYVLYNKDQNRFYIGYTDNLKRRVKEHDSGKSLSDRIFKKFDLVYYEACKAKKDATKRERQLKTGFGRKYLRERLSESVNIPS